MSEPKPLGDRDRINAVIERQRLKAAQAAKESPPAPPQPTNGNALAMTQETAPAKTTKPRARGRSSARQAVALLQGQALPEPFSPWYYSPELIQCCLPHSDPKTRDWIRKNGNVSLIVSSGVDKDGVPYGVPYGVFPRLMLAYIITQVFEKKERRIKLSSHFGEFLKAIGYTSNFRGNNRKSASVKNQISRLLNATISFRYEDDKRLSGLNMQISPKYDLWWDFENKDQDAIFDSWIEVTEEFYKSILNNPVPLNIDIIKDLGKDTLAIDLYMWLTYRFFLMSERRESKLSITYNSLQVQFGSNYGEDSYRVFRQRLREAMQKVAGYPDENGVWQPGLWRIDGRKPGAAQIQYAFTDEGLVLDASPPSVSRKRPTLQEDAASIFEAQRFDYETRKKVMILAPLWPVDDLEKRYFAWVEQKPRTIGNPRAHFLKFVRSHLKRNGVRP